MAVVGLLPDGTGRVITIGLSLENVDRVSKSLGQVEHAIIPTMTKTANRGIWQHVVSKVRTRIAQESGIGQAIWGRDLSGMEKQGLVRTGRLLIGEGGTTWGQVSLVLRGIPSLVENGGRIKPHTIRNGFGHRGRRIPHPGMTLRPHRIGRDSFSAAEDRIRNDVDAAVGEMLKRRGL